MGGTVDTGTVETGTVDTGIVETGMVDDGAPIVVVVRTLVVVVLTEVDGVEEEMENNACPLAVRG